MIEGVKLIPLITHTDEHTFIYGLFDPRNLTLRYIGKADNPQSRLRRHIYLANGSNRNHHVSNWIRELLSDGLEPSVEILEEVSKDNWQQVEQAWIMECKKFGLDLVNRTKGGDGLTGFEFNDEVKKKMRQSHLGNALSEETKKKLSEANKGKNTWSKGRKPTPETIEKIKLSNKGRKHSEETKKKLSESRMGEGNPMYGKTRSEESLKKASQSLKGRIVTTEHRANLSKALKGHSVSQETIEKFRAKLKGRKLPEETKQKMSIAQNQRRARERFERANSGS